MNQYTDFQRLAPTPHGPNCAPRRNHSWGEVPGRAATPTVSAPAHTGHHPHQRAPRHPNGRPRATARPPSPHTPHPTPSHPHHRPHPQHSAAATHPTTPHSTTGGLPQTTPAREPRPPPAPTPPAHGAGAHPPSRPAPPPTQQRDTQHRSGTRGPDHRRGRSQPLAASAPHHVKPSGAGARPASTPLDIIPTTTHDETLTSRSGNPPPDPPRRGRQHPSAAPALHPTRGAGAHLTRYSTRTRGRRALGPRPEASHRDEVTPGRRQVPSTIQATTFNSPSLRSGVATPTMPPWRRRARRARWPRRAR